MRCRPDYAELLIGLDINAIGTVVEVEVVDVVEPMKVCRVELIWERNPEAFGFFAVDLHQYLRSAGGVSGVNGLRREFGALAGSSKELLQGGVQLLGGAEASLLKLIGKASKCAETLNGWRSKGNDQGIGDGAQRSAKESITASNECCLTFALGDGLEVDEHESAIGSSTAEAKAGNGKDSEDVGLRMISALARSATLEVYSSEAASGACTSTMKYP